MKTSPSGIRPLSSVVCLTALLVASGLALSAQAQTPATAALPEVDHWVYLSELPDPAELSQNAVTNGLTVQRIDRTADAVIITYKYPDGVVGSMGYKLLSAVRASDRVAGGSASLRTVPPAPTTTVVERTVIEREPEIIYVDRTPRTRVVYRERDDFWLPLTVGLGIGYISGHNSHHHYPRYYSGHYRSYRGPSYYRSHRGHGRR